MRKLATAAAVSLVLSSGGVRALGLGDIEMRSALNQPMNAEIPLTSVKAGEAEGMIVQLASPDAFLRAGIERTNVLADLRFSVDQSGSQPVIRISSQRPVVEPFLNFLLEVDWPSGRMVREYTVLLDPPVFMSPNTSSRNTAAEQPAVVERSASVLTPTPIADNTAVVDTFEESAVEIVGSAEEVPNTLDGGEAVSLSGLGAEPVGDVVLIEESNSAVEISGGDVVELTDLEPVVDTDAAGDVVALTDLEAVNTDAQLDVSEIEFSVELVGGTEEVSDSFVFNGDAAAPADTGTIVELGEESSVVSLEDLTVSDTASSGDSAAAGREITVQSGDTMLQIARNNAVSGVSAQQMMIALVNANRNAFINGNVNLVKAGAILRVPEVDELTRLSQNQALAQLSEQNQLWQEYRDSVRSQATTVAQAPSSSDTAAETAADTGSEADSTASNTTEDATGTGSGALESDAKKILDTAREEVLERDELKIVAQNTETDTSASATADNSEASDAARLGEINRKLQLAREELASTRLESQDLSEQSAELTSTTENMESLVSIRQKEVARLQEQLKQAQLDSDAAGDAVDATGNAVGDAVTNAGDTVTGAVTDATQAAGELAGNAENAATDVASVVGAGTADADNALTAQGEQLAEVELLGETADSTADAAVQGAADTTQASTRVIPWYESLLQQYGKWLVIGIGAISALLAGWLLFFKRRRKEDDILDFDDEVEFIDDAADNADASVGGATAAVAAAGAAAVGGVAASADDKIAAAEDMSLNADAELPAFGGDTDIAEAGDVDDIDADDTISEADVYLAYGLHGQAEELLGKAVARDPDNHEYAYKLLQTHHAQGNAEGFTKVANDYQSRFGNNPEANWEQVAHMGHELQPGNALFAGAADTIESVGRGDYKAETLDDNDFLSADDSVETSSISRDFAAESTDDGVDESTLMDQSLDPAFAFDETDLEATGDFSQIADELASEESVAGNDDGSLDFPGFDAPEIESSTPDAATLDVGTVDVAGEGILDDALSLDELNVDGIAAAANDGGADSAGSVADDLTLDLDQLSGDLEFEGTELLDGNTDNTDFEIPDLTADNELLTGDSDMAASDEMDTMMDLAKAYIDMGDKDSASSALGEIVKSGTPEQVTEAETLLRKIS